MSLFTEYVDPSGWAESPYVASNASSPFKTLRLFHTVAAVIALGPLHLPHLPQAQARTIRLRILSTTADRTSAV